MKSDLASVFAKCAHRGWACALGIDDERHLEYGGNVSVVGASTFKMAVALELCARLAVGSLDSRRTVEARDHESGKIDVISIWRAAVRMMSVSDNAATDALIDLLTPEKINQRLQRCGLTNTIVRPEVQKEVSEITRELDGCIRSFEPHGWLALAHEFDSLPENRRRSLEAIEIPADVPTAPLGARTTATDMATLVRRVWRDEAAPAAACANVRQLMAYQTVRRLAHVRDHRPDATVAAKGGRIPGLIRNDVGAISTKKGRYAIAIFTRAVHPFAGQNLIDAGIGRASSQLIAEIEKQG